MAAIFFDLDGTLADSAGGITASLDHALRTVTGGVSVEDWRVFIGPPLQECLAHALPNLDPALIPSIVREFRRHYDSVGLLMTTAYPDAQEVLASLADRGVASYIVTNKPFRAASAVAVHLGLDRHVRRIVGGDTDFGRPTTTATSKADRAAWLAVEEGISGGVFVGDGLDDLHAAERLGARFFLAEWGYGVARVLAEHPTVDRLERLADVLKLRRANDAATS